MVTFDKFESIHLKARKLISKRTESLLIREIDYHNHISIKYTF